MEKLHEYIDDINENIEKLESRGPVSKYVLPDENLRGRSVLSVSVSQRSIVKHRKPSLLWKRIPVQNLSCHITSS